MHYTPSVPGEDWWRQLDVTFLREPASEATVREAEHRLGLELPPSYRAFLAVSNGADAARFGPPPLGFDPAGNFGLRRVQHIGLARDLLPPDVFDMWLSVPFSDPIARPPIVGQAPVDEEQNLEQLREAVMITYDSSPSGNFDVLIPHGEVEWNMWSFERDGATAYSSFGAWLEDAVAALRRMRELQGP